MNTLHLPVLGNGDGGAFTTADDLHRFWLALLAGRIVSRETVDRMTQPRHDVPDENMRYGMGFWMHRTHPALILEGYDAGASFRSTHLVGANDGERAREQHRGCVAGGRRPRPGDRAELDDLGVQGHRAPTAPPSRILIGQAT